MEEEEEVAQGHADSQTSKAIVYCIRAFSWRNSINFPSLTPLKKKNKYFSHLASIDDVLQP